MIHEMTMLQNLSGRKTYEALVHTLYNQCKEFPDIYQKYLDAIAQLRTELGNNTTPSVDMFVTAIEMQCCSNMLFAGFQGLKMNYDHFLNPMMPNITWKQIDFTETWREELSGDLPMYHCAQVVIDDFFNQLTEEQRERLYEPIGEYESELHVTAPKLAHYYGYKMGNSLLRLVVPAYHDDPTIDLRYSRILEDYFGRPLDMSQWEGCFNPKVWKFAPFEERDEQDDVTYREQVMHYPGKVWEERREYNRAHGFATMKGTATEEGTVPEDVVTTE